MDEFVASSRSAAHPVPVLATVASHRDSVDELEDLLVCQLQLLQERMDTFLINVAQGSELVLVRHSVCVLVKRMKPLVTGISNGEWI